MERKFLSLPFTDDRYSSLLKNIPDAPERLFISGSLPPPDALSIAIVGTRKATAQGKLLAKKIAHELALRNITIVSGLAIGIDTAAHEGAVEAGGKTLAVLANGIDTIYPSQNRHLADRIIANGGAILSEYPLQTPAYPNQFLERNRIVSGLCIATVVIEAPERSGTLATARFALEQGREVFIVPGSPDHPNYAGSHRLIREGARLVTSAADICEDLGLLADPTPKNKQGSLLAPQSPHADRILVALADAGTPLSVDKLSELTTMEARAINATLATLVMEGMVKETERGYSI